MAASAPAAPKVALAAGVEVEALPPRGNKRRRRRGAAAAAEAEAERREEAARAADEAAEDEAAEAAKRRRPKGEAEAAARPAREVKYEYRDHTADIQLHSWGDTMAEAFENAAIAMFGYMTELDAVEVDDSLVIEVEAEGRDLKSLLYKFLDEFLYNFSTEDNVCKDVRITMFDAERMRLRAVGHGEKFSLDKHPQGTEIKAITYSHMQIYDRPEKERPEIFVIVDI